jgi:TonB family protein
MNVNEPQTVASRTGTAPSSEARYRLVIRVRLTPKPAPPAPTRRSWLGAIGVAASVALIGLLWLAFRPSNEASAPSASLADDAQSAARNQAANDTVPAPSASTARVVVPADPSLPVVPRAQDASSPPVPVHEALPDVPQSALRTIRGTVRVAMRVTIDRDGKVTAVSTAAPGPSRYFERLSREAAHEWLFSPSATQDERTLLIRFHYTRDGVNAFVEAPE